MRYMLLVLYHYLVDYPHRAVPLLDYPKYCDWRRGNCAHVSCLLHLQRFTHAFAHPSPILDLPYFENGLQVTFSWKGTCPQFFLKFVKLIHFITDGRRYSEFVRK